MEEIFIKGKDNEKIFLRIWNEVKNPKGIVQIFHGMVEHSERYDDFARFLNKKGYIVCADDHRGHGNTAESGGMLGYLGNNGFYNIVEDEYIITKMIKEKYKLPVYVFAHSFGSFIGQEYITKYSKEIQGIILSGSARQDGIDVKLGKAVATIQMKVIGGKKKAKLIDKLSFGSFNKQIQNPKSKFDWLTRDSKQVNKYANDEYCTFMPTIDFYYNLFNGLSNLYDINKLINIDKELPILVVAGDKDPVGKNGESVKELYNQYKNLNINKVSIRLYENARHEILNEINNEEVYKEIYEWISNI